MKYNIFVKRFSSRHLKSLNKRQLKKLKFSGWFSDRMNPSSFKCDDYMDIFNRKLDEKLVYKGTIFLNRIIHVYDDKGNFVRYINGHWGK